MEQSGEMDFFKKTISISLLLVTVLSCTSKEDLILKNSTERKSKIFEEIKFKKNALFSLENEINKRNIKKYDKFNIIFYEKGKIVESYFLIKLLPWQKDYSLNKPFEIFFEDIKDGTVAGAKYGYNFLPKKLKMKK